MSRADKFFEMSTQLPLEEIKDERDEHAIPELTHVAVLRDAGNMQDAIDYATSLSKMYPDYDLIPFMIAYIYYQKEFPQEAIHTALEAIPSCKRKYRLYSVVGLAEYAQNNLENALVWWSRSVIAQCVVADYQEADPFLHLAHVAEALGARQESQVLFTMVDAIEPDSPRLGETEESRLRALKKSWVKDPIIRVIKHIDANYLHS
jgi:tetratricopeptide (TPR) repeat protein